ncbi:SDR family oxidoreductase [Plantactinospora mayteni]|uniref:3-oxoacyl-ACP reductase n=1 Tax=Plantactinospora mayteni TaxID=566021 RepID=A0ABQ4EHG7_9ACTN|nr:SDR family oxidoreductase [Plantactinospora mayteni]GIG94177.1 3-oxoacyl-ACP reductase [Plantactinospora mayteni]
MRDGDGAPVRVALVTGAGRGLGAEIARTLGRAGFAVAVNDLASSPGALAVVEDIRAAGGEAGLFPADVTAEDAVSGLVAEVQRRLGEVQVLVVNATGPQPVIGVEDLRWQDLLDQLVFFVKSPTLLVQAVLPGMKARGGGRIVNIGSDLFERAAPGFSAYSAAKGAQLGLTRTWARELGQYGITVNLVAPGWIPVERHAEVPTEVLQTYADEVALRRFGSPGEVAATVAFLASPEAAFITGERIAVNGGHTIA